MITALVLGVIAWFTALPLAIMLAVALLWLVVVFLPIVIAFQRHARSRWWIVLLSLVLGHTGILWIAALVWACVGEVEAPYAHYGDNGGGAA